MTDNQKDRKLKTDKQRERYKDKQRDRQTERKIDVYCIVRQFHLIELLEYYN